MPYLGDGLEQQRLDGIGMAHAYFIVRHSDEVTYAT